MKSLRIAWATLYFAGMMMIVFDLGLRSIYDVNSVPVISALGAAFVLLSITSMLNWTFKEAWEDRNRANLAARNDNQAG